jgi:hypothetical protein
VVLYSVHEPSHQPQAATTRALEGLSIGRVWSSLRTEPRAFVCDANVESFRRDLIANLYPLVGIELIPVLDRIDQGLFHRQFDREQVAITVTDAPEACLDPGLEGLDFRKVTRDGHVFRDRPVLAHGLPPDPAFLGAGLEEYRVGSVQE